MGHEGARTREAEAAVESAPLPPVTEARMKKWDYKVLTLPTIHLEGHLNGTATEGWRVISVTVTEKTSLVVFERERP